MMTDRDDTTVRCQKDTKKIAEQAKHPGETWDDFILRLAETPPEFVTVVPNGDVDADALAERYTATVDWQPWTREANPMREVLSCPQCGEDVAATADFTFGGINLEVPEGDGDE